MSCVRSYSLAEFTLTALQIMYIMDAGLRQYWCDFS